MSQLQITTIGQTKIAQAITTGEDINLTSFVYGSGDGSSLTESSTALGTLEYTGTISDTQTTSDTITLSGSIPATEGGYTVREFGIIDDDGDLIAYANFPDTYKPASNEETKSTLSVTAELQVDNNGTGVTVVVDANGQYLHRINGGDVENRVTATGNENEDITEDGNEHVVLTRANAAQVVDPHINRVDPSKTTFGINGGLLPINQQTSGYTAGTGSTNFYANPLEFNQSHPCVQIKIPINENKHFSKHNIKMFWYTTGAGDGREATHFIDLDLIINYRDSTQLTNTYKVDVKNSTTEFADNNNNNKDNPFFVTESADNNHKYYYIHYQMQDAYMQSHGAYLIRGYEFECYKLFMHEGSSATYDVVQEQRGVTFSEADGINVIYPYVKNGSTTEFFQDHIDGGNSLGITQIYDANGNTYADADAYFADNAPYQVKLFSDRVTDKIQEHLPIGFQSLWPALTPPDNWLVRDGSLLLIADYPELFAVIGNTFGGDGVIDFALPIANDGSFERPLDLVGVYNTGRALGSLELSQNLAHTHTVLTNKGTSQQNEGGDAGGGYQGALTQTTSSNGGSESRPTNRASGIAIIKYA